MPRSLPLVALVLSLTLALPLSGAGPTVVKLWDGKAPGETKDIGPEALTEPKPGQADVKRLGNVSDPTITVYPAPKDKANGCAVVVAPGGGYSILAIEHEGTQTCEWLNTLGVTAVLLKYRVPKRDLQTPDNLAALQDAQQAILLTRRNAKDWNIDPNRVGMLGFSAGGHLTVCACLADRLHVPHAADVDRRAYRPDFAVLVYPAYLTDKGGDLKAEFKVTKDAPPTFFAHANDDGVSPLGSAALYAALAKNGVPAELHVYASGGHGFGMRKSAHPIAAWPARCGDWLKARGYLTPKK